MNFKSIASSIKTGTLFVTDYAEVGVDKTVAGVKVASVKTVTTVKAHRVAKSDRMVARKEAREVKKVEAALKAEAEAFAAHQAEEAAAKA